MAKRVLVNEDSLKDIAAAIKEKIGNEEASFTPGEMGEAIRGIEAGAEANLGELIAEANGGYFAEDFGYDGFHTVYVEVEGEAPEASLGDIIITENGTYYATDEGYDGFLSVEVDVQGESFEPSYTDIDITENGDYYPGDYAADFFSEVRVNVPSGGGDLPEEALNITGDCSYRFSNRGWDWFINEYGNRITTKDIDGCNQMFMNSQVEYIPFDINCKTNQFVNFSNMFDGAQQLKEAPRVLGQPKVVNMGALFNNCRSLESIPDDFADGFDWSNVDNMTGPYSGGQMHTLFTYCYRLRKVPMDIFKHGNPMAAYSYSYFSNLFQGCYSLDEVRELPNIYINAGWTSNVFGNSFNGCYRLKEMTFALQDNGSPYVANWKSQTIDLTKNIGYVPTGVFSLDYYLKDMNSTCNTYDKQVLDADTYAALKDDPDWWTGDVAYSRYNHTSAVNTINSLPDVSASGGVNTIKFTGAAGSATDGGAINTLTDAEIAVAAAKGWTVSLV